MLVKSLLPLSVSLFTFSACLSQAPDLSRLRLPDGFEIGVFASDVAGARTILVAPDGIVYIGTREQGTVYALVDTNADGRADKTYTLVSGLNFANGLAMREGSLFVSDGPRIFRYDDMAARLSNPPDPVVIVEDLPPERSHGWRYMGFGPDDRLYVAIGTPCNTCEMEPPYSSIISMAPDGTARRVVARGIRNSVGFDWDPIDQSLWFTDNNPDRMGDDIPSCELNRVGREGDHFGFPYIHQGDFPDPEYGAGHSAEDYVAPVLNLGAHVAPLGIAFYTGSMFPAEYRNQLFVAEHGSWNRSSKVGYRVVLVRRDGTGKVLGESVFLDGFLQGEEAWGRPVDVAQMRDGSLLVSDNSSGTVYRITYAAD